MSWNLWAERKAKALLKKEVPFVVGRVESYLTALEIHPVVAIILDQEKSVRYHEE